MASKFRPMEELKRDMAQLDLLVETDVQVHHVCIFLLVILCEM